ncbi:putative serine/threonine-protein kinase isoform X2 [Iris pallida]|uniref:Serine/threonine-protein kinase isoform X2 n=1 Tax=Iris pallida TaxID=29817 RepID=A0AAX6H960_IRIPA|nr:putative serine/threonine-protein kinase isoform X2 [Iris pallida]
MQETTRRSSKAYKDPQEAKGINILAAQPEESETSAGEVNGSGGKSDHSRLKGDTRRFVDLKPMDSINAPDDGRHTKHASGGDIPFSGPLQVNSSSGFAWVKKTKEDRPLDRSHSKSRSRSHVSSGALDPSSILQAKNILTMNGQAVGHAANESCGDSKGHESYEIAKQAMLKKWAQLERPDSFNFSDLYHSQEFSKGICMADAVSVNRSIMGYQDQGERVDFSGPLLSQAHKVDELLEKHERHIRQAVRRSWFQRGRRQHK